MTYDNLQMTRKLCQAFEGKVADGPRPRQWRCTQFTDDLFGGPFGPYDAGVNHRRHSEWGP